MAIQGTQKFNRRKTSFVQSIHIFSKPQFFWRVQKCCNLVNQKLQDAHHKYSVDIFKQNQAEIQFHQQNLGNHKQGINVSEIEIDGAKNVDKKAICKAFNKSFVERGKYSGDFVTLNIHKLDHCSEKFHFRVLTWMEIYKTITFDSLENIKSPGPGFAGFVHAWASKTAKYAIGTHLQFIFNEFNQNSVFPTILKHAYVIPIRKKGSTTQVCNYQPIAVTPTFAKFLSSFSFSKWWITLIKTICWIKSNLDSKTKNLQQIKCCLSLRQ